MWRKLVKSVSALYCILTKVISAVLSVTAPGGGGGAVPRLVPRLWTFMPWLCPVGKPSSMQHQFYSFHHIIFHTNRGQVFSTRGNRRQDLESNFSNIFPLREGLPHPTPIPTRPSQAPQCWDPDLRSDGAPLVPKQEQTPSTCTATVFYMYDLSPLRSVINWKVVLHWYNTHPSVFGTECKHDDGSTVELPDESPEVVFSWRQRTLRRYKLSLWAVTLPVKHRKMMFLRSYVEATSQQLDAILQRNPIFKYLKKFPILGLWQVLRRIS